MDHPVFLPWQIFRRKCRPDPPTPPLHPSRSPSPTCSFQGSLLSHKLVPALLGSLQTYTQTLNETGDFDKKSHVAESQEAVLKLLALIYISDSTSSTAILCHGMFSALCQILTASLSLLVPLAHLGDNGTPSADIFRQEQTIHCVLELLCVVLPPLSPSNPLSAPVYLTPLHSWRWKDDFQNLCEYDQSMSQRIEQEYRRQQKQRNLQTMDLVWNGRQYLLHFGEMVQVNKLSRISRPLIRDPLPRLFLKKRSRTASMSELDRSLTSVSEGLPPRTATAIGTEVATPAAVNPENRKQRLASIRTKLGQWWKRGREKCGLCTASADVHTPSPQPSPASVQTPQPAAAILANAASFRRSSVVSSTLGEARNADETGRSLGDTIHPDLILYITAFVIPTLLRVINSTVNTALIEDAISIISRILTFFSTVAERDSPSKNRREDVLTRYGDAKIGRCSELLKDQSHLLCGTLSGLMASCSKFSISSEILCPALLCCDALLNLDPATWVPCLLRHGVRGLVEDLLQSGHGPQVDRFLRNLLATQFARDGIHCSLARAGSAVGGPLAVSRTTGLASSFGSSSAAHTADSDGSIAGEAMDYISILNDICDRWESEIDQCIPHGIIGLVNEVESLVYLKGPVTSYELTHSKCRLLPCLYKHLPAATSYIPKLPPSTLSVLRSMFQLCVNWKVTLSAPRPTNPIQSTLPIAGLGGASHLHFAMFAQSPNAALLLTLGDRMARPLTIKLMPYVDAASENGSDGFRSAASATSGCSSEGAFGSGDSPEPVVVAVFPFVTLAAIEHFLHQRWRLQRRRNASQLKRRAQGETEYVDCGESGHPEPSQHEAESASSSMQTTSTQTGQGHCQASSHDHLLEEGDCQEEEAHHHSSASIPGTVLEADVADENGDLPVHVSPNPCQPAPAAAAAVLRLEESSASSSEGRGKERVEPAVGDQSSPSPSSSAEGHPHHQILVVEEMDSDRVVDLPEDETNDKELEELDFVIGGNVVPKGLTILEALLLFSHIGQSLVRIVEQDRDGCVGAGAHKSIAGKALGFWSVMFGVTFFNRSNTRIAHHHAAAATPMFIDRRPPPVEDASYRMALELLTLTSVASSESSPSVPAVGSPSRPAFFPVPTSSQLCSADVIGSSARNPTNFSPPMAALSSLNGSNQCGSSSSGNGMESRTVTGSQSGRNNSLVGRRPSGRQSLSDPQTAAVANPRIGIGLGVGVVGAGSVVITDHFDNTYHSKLSSSLLHHITKQPLVFAFPALLALADQKGDEGLVAMWRHPTLFPLSIRRTFFDYVSFGARSALVRSISPSHHVFPISSAASSSSSMSSSSFGLGGGLRASGLIVGMEYLQSAKHRGLTVRRGQWLLHDGMLVLKQHASSPLLMDISFKGEAGTGLGPTVEFYCLVSRELQREDLGLWRSLPPKEGDGPSSTVPKAHEYVRAPRGLYPTILPATLTESERQSVANYFTFFGRLLGRSLREGRTLDLHLSPVLWDMLQGRDVLADAEGNLGLIEPELERSLERLQEMANRANSTTPLSDRQRLEAEVADLCLDFTLPGHPDNELIEGGHGTMVTLENLSTYIDLVRLHHLTFGIEFQIQAILSGLSDVFPRSHLLLFTRRELVDLVEGRLDGNGKIWTRRPELLADIVCDHGYTLESKPVMLLLDVLLGWPGELQQKFLAFISGSPRMPLGGLSPKLTIVKRDVVDESGSGPSADRYLPTCNTCFHYLKLPEYPDAETLAEKLKLAINDGQESFDLS